MLPDPADHRIRVGAERRRRMRAQLAEASLRVMAELGPDRTTVDAVIQAAGVSRGTFYKYYNAPSELIRAVATDLAQDLILSMAPKLDAIADPAQRLAVAFRSTLQLARQNPLLAGFLINIGWPSASHVPAFIERAGTNLLAGMAQNRFRTTPLAVAQILVGGMVIGTLAEQLQPDAAPDLESQATQTLLLALGLDPAEAKALATMPIDPTILPEGGLLSRAKTTA